MARPRKPAQQPPRRYRKERQLTMQPDISHYYGRTVEDIGEEGDGWYVELEGGIRIVNMDAAREMPDESLVGKKLSKSVMEASQTRLYFGTDDNPMGTVMYLSPTEYGISEPRFQGGEIYKPQDADTMQLAEAEAAAPSAPGDRVVDGPQTPPAAEEETEEDEA